MTDQKQHPINSITFYNPPYNSQQSTAVNQQPLQQTISFSSPQYVSYTPLISSPSSPTVGANLSHHVHPTMQAPPPPSTVNLQQLPPQFFHLYTRVPIQNPQIVIPTFTPISADVKVAKVISPSSDASSLSNVKVAKVVSTEVKDFSSSSINTKIVNDEKNVSSSSNTSTSPTENVKVVSSSSITPSSAGVKDVKVFSSSSITPSSAGVKDVKVFSSSSISPSFTDVKDVEVVSSSSIAPSSTNVKVVLSSSNTPSCISSTPRDRKIQRLERNRLAARECRERRKAYILNLENRTSKLEDDNLILRQKVQELTTKLELMEYINQDNIRLENLVKELKRKVKEQKKAMKRAKEGADVIKDDVIIDDHDCVDVRIVKMESEDH